MKSVSSLEPSPPTPKASPSNEIGLPPNSAENTANDDRSMFHSKRLCERWLDNLFMVLYEVCTRRYKLTTGFTSLYTLAGGMGTFH